MYTPPPPPPTQPRKETQLQLTVIPAPDNKVPFTITNVLNGQKIRFDPQPELGEIKTRDFAVSVEKITPVEETKRLRIEVVRSVESGQCSYVAYLRDIELEFGEVPQSPPSPSFYEAVGKLVDAYLPLFGLTGLGLKGPL